MVRFSGDGNADSETAIVDSSAAAFGIGTMFGLGTLALAVMIGQDATSSLVALAAVTPFLLIQDHWRHVCFTSGQPARAALNDAVWGITLLITLAAIETMGISAQAHHVVLIWGFSSLPAVVLAGFLGKNRPTVPRATRWLKSHSDLGKFFAGEFLLERSAFEFATFSIGIFAGVAALGRVRAARLVFGPLTILTSAATSVGVREGVHILSQRGPRGLRMFSLKIGVSLGISAAALTIAALAVPTAAGITVFGPSWEEIRPFLLPTGVFLAAAGLAAGCRIGLRVTEKARTSFKIRTLTAMLALPLGILGAQWGALPALWMLALANSVAAIAWAIGLRRSTATRTHSNCPQRVLLNCTRLASHQAGIRVLTVRSVAALLTEREAPNIVLCGTRESINMIREPSPTRFDGLVDSGRIHLRILPAALAGSLGRLIFEQLWLPLLARSTKCDIIHSFDYTFPILARRPNHLVTITDLHYLASPDSFSASGLWLRRFFFRMACRDGRRIFTISKASKAELVRRLGARSDNIAVLPLGGSEPPAQVSLTGRQLSSAPVILTVGTLRPHKNHQTIIRALALRELRDATLILVGADAGEQDRLRAEAERLEVSERLVIAGKASDAELRDYSRRADVYVSASLYEGFGLPLMEAMEAGLPIACSRIPAHEEVAGEAAIYFEPNDPVDAARAILQALDPQTRPRLAEAADRILRTRTWKATADAILDAYYQGMSRPRSLISSSHIPK